MVDVVIDTDVASVIQKARAPEWVHRHVAIVILVARHDRTSNDIYRQLLDALDIGVPEDKREKPPCCDDSGQPPADRHVALDIADAVERGARAGRRRAR